MQLAGPTHVIVVGATNGSYMQLAGKQRGAQLEIYCRISAHAAEVALRIACKDSGWLCTSLTNYVSDAGNSPRLHRATICTGSQACSVKHANTEAVSRTRGKCSAWGVDIQLDMPASSSAQYLRPHASTPRISMSEAPEFSPQPKPTNRSICSRRNGLYVDSDLDWC